MNPWGSWVFEPGFLGVSPYGWAVFVGVVAVTATVVLVVRGLLRRWVSGFAGRTATHVDDVVADLLVRTRANFAITVGLLVGVAVLTLPPEVEAGAVRLAVILLVIQAGFWGAGLVQASIDRFVEARNDPQVRSATGILRVLGVVAVWSIVVLLVLSNLGVDVTAGIAGLGIGGVAVALAAQNILGDLFASLSIVLDRPFVVGDTILVGDMVGTVEHIGIKTTRVRALSGEQLVFGNGDLLASRIRNFRDQRERRVVVTIGVAYETPRDVLARIPDTIRDVVATQPNLRFDRAHLVRFAASSIDYEVVWYVTVGDMVPHLDAQQAVLLGILDRFAALGVDIAYPTQTVWNRERADQK